MNELTSGSNLQSIDNFPKVVTPNVFVGVQSWFDLAHHDPEPQSNGSQFRLDSR